MRQPKNFFNVGVRFKSHSYSVQDRGREGKTVTPEIVLSELEDFCRRIRRDLKIQKMRREEPSAVAESLGITEQRPEE